MRDINYDNLGSSLYDFLVRVFDVSDFPPRWYCGRWSAVHGWLYLLSDLAIWAAYLVIPAVLAFFLVRRRSLPFRPLLLLFVLFILACGTTHLLDAASFWWPAYRLSALVRLATAAISWTTVLAFVPVVPRVLSLRTPEELEREIASRRRTEEALRESEERYRLLIDGVTEYAIFTLDATGHVTSWNSGAERIKGYTAAEALGLPLARFCTDDELQADLAAQLLRAATESGTAQSEGWQLRKDGTRFWASVVLTALRDRDGVLKGFSKITRDLTGRKHAEDLLRATLEHLEQRVAARTAELQALNAVLREEKKRFQTLVETAPGAIHTFRQAPDGTASFPYASPSFHAIFGCTPEQVAHDASAVLALVHPDDYGRMVRRLHACAQAGRPCREEFRVRHSQRGELWVEAYAAPHTEADGSVVWHGFFLDITTRKAAEESVHRLNAVLEQRVTERTAALAASEARYRKQSDLLQLIVDSMVEGVVVADQTGLFLLFNPAAEKLLGKQDAQMPPEHWSAHYRVFELDGVTPAATDDLPLVRAFRGITTRGRLLAIKRDGGALVIIECWANPLRSADHQLMGGVVVFRDVTELRAAAAALRDNETRLALALAAARMGVWEWTLASNVLFWSPECYQIAGLTHPVAVMEDFQHLIHASDVEPVSHALRQAVANHVPFEREFRLVCANGAVKWVMILARTEYDGQGRPLRVVGALQDVSERKTAEERLRHSEARFRTFADHATDSFFLHDEDGTVLDVNRRACEFLQYSREELIGMSPKRFNPHVTPELAAQVMGHLEADGSTAFDAYYCRKDGTQLAVEVRLRRFESGSRRMAVALVGDISVRKAAEERLRAALEEKQVLLREIHHRVKNNLQVICSLLDMQARQAPQSDPAAALHEAQDRVYSMALIHEQLYQHDTLSSIDFADYLRGLVNRLAGAYQHGTPEVSVHLDLAPLMLPVDLAVPCGLIVNELTCNALKHAFGDRQNGNVAVRLAREYSGVTVTVQDDGQGLAPGIDFRQPKTLGLRLVAALVEQIGGSVRMARDGGTSICVELPMPAAPNP